MTPCCRKKILVVEDDVQVLFALEKRLTHAGFDVVTTRSGGSAIDCAESEQPAAITLDLRLPDMDGIEVAQRLRTVAQTCAIPIVFIAGKIDRQFKEECNADGNMYFIRKPYDPDLLIRILKALVVVDEPPKLQKATNRIRPMRCLPLVPETESITFDEAPSLPGAVHAISHAQ